MFCFDEMPCLVAGLHEGMFCKANDMPALLAEGGSRPPADLLSAAGMPDHQKVGKELAPTAPIPPASSAGNLRRQALGAVRQDSLRAGALRSNRLPQIG